ncbi:MAG: hypothetical protein KJ063_01060 [Anaerolineae bacterium]|nr:hypothetical protein [Anaerolineae bacterium]
MTQLSNRNIILILLLIFLLMIALLLGVRNQTWQQITALWQKPTPTTEPPQITDLLPQTYNEHGVSVAIPADWVSQSVIIGVTIASSEATLDITSFDQLQQEGVMVIIPGEIDVLKFQVGAAFPSEDPVDLLNLYIDLLKKEGQEYLWIVPPERFTIDHQQGAKTIVQSRDGNVTLEILMATIVNPDSRYLAFVSTAAIQDNAAALRPTFEAILNTIHVDPPQSAPNQSP